MIHLLEGRAHRISCGIAGVFGACIVIASTGCGRAAQVSGTITLNGQSVAGAEVVFELQDGSETASFYGISSANGVYTLDDRGQGGIPPGKYRVTVTRHILKSGAPIPVGVDDEAAEVLKEDGRTLTKTETFSKDVVSGKNTIDLPLSESSAKS